MADSAVPAPRVTAPAIAARKDSGRPVVMVTAYDAPSARVVDAAGADVILVGDSVANVVLGYADTLQVTIDDMAHHVGAVARTEPHALVVGDLPWLSYHVSIPDTVTNAARLIRAGAGAVKLEGGRKRLDAVGAILDAEIPVMGHLGLTPQSLHALGGFRVQGKDIEAARAIVDDAVALADAGCFAIVLECVPDAVARLVTDTVGVPTIGIGAGRHCDGQVLVYHDLLGIEEGKAPKFVRRYASLGADARAAVTRFAEDVRAGRFPSSDETYHAADAVADSIELYGRPDVDGPAVPEPRLGVGHPRVKRPRRAIPIAIGAAFFAVLLALVLWRVGSDESGGTDGAGTASTGDGAVSGTVAASAPFASLTAGTVRVGGRTLSVVIADSEPEREQGLRGRSDATPYDGMLFVFPDDTIVAFTMAGVPDPLDIGFYGADGAGVDHLRMQPCAGTDATCPVYRAQGPFRYAIETGPGGLPPGSLAVGQGSSSIAVTRSTYASPR